MPALVPAADAVPEGVAVLDAGGTVVHATDAFCELIGWSRHEVAGRALPHPWWPGSQGARVLAAREEADRHGSAERRVTVRRPDGGRVTATLRLTALRAADGTPGGHVLALRDPAAVRRAEDAAREGDARLRLVVENVSEMVALCDPSGVIQDASGACRAVVGRPASGLGGRALHELCHPDDRPRLDADVEAARSAPGRPVTTRWRALRPGGRPSWVESRMRARPDGSGGAAALEVAVRDVSERVRVEQALEVDRERHRRLVEALAAGIVVIGPDGAVEQANPAAERILGMGEEEIRARGLAAEDWVPVGPDGGDLARALAGPEPLEAFRAAVRRGDGGTAWVEGAVAVLAAPAGGRPGAVVSFLDAGERVAAETALRESEARFRIMAENATDLVARQDPGGRFLWVSPSALRITGYAASELRGRDLFGLVDPVDQYRLRRAFDRVLAGGEERATYRFRHARGRWMWLETIARGIAGADGVVLEVQTSTRDVTAAVASADRLGASEERFRHLVENASDLVGRLGPGGVVTYLAPSCESVLGRPPSDYVGRRLADAVHPDDRAALVAAIARPRRTASPAFRLRTRLGRWVWLEARLRPVRSPEGADEIQMSARDVTDRVLAEEERRAADTRLRAAIDAGSDPFLLLAATRGPDGEVDDFIVLDLNDAAEALAGLTRDALVGRPISETMPVNRERGFIRLYAEVVASGEPLRDEVMLGGDGGPPRWLARTAVRSGEGVAITVRDITDRKEREAEEAALRRVATAVAGAAPPEAVVQLVAEEAMGLLAADGGLVSRFAEPGRVEVAGTAGTVERPSGAAAEVLRVGAAARVDPGSGEDPAVSGVAAPIRASGRLWGAVEAVAARAGAFPPGAEERLERFADLVGLAVQNADDRDRLARLAASDALTGLANHRAFHERMREEARRAARHGRTLSLVLLDLDHFKEVNDSHGHQAGDRVLAEVAHALTACARPGDLVGRIGGEEFGWLLPETDAEGAFAAAERGRAAVAALRFAEVGAITVSAGVCDLARAGGDVTAMAELADGALYWAKAEGRDRCCLYSPEVVHELSAHERAERLERGRALAALKALARAVDAKDHSTHLHSERVAALACAVAERLGWPAHRVALLHESALLHDVGKIGVPDAVLFAPGPVRGADLAQLRMHAALGGDISGEALTPEQAAWVRSHHERWDGDGYPDGLAGEDIPEGARILALADAWDAMTVARHYGRTLPAAEAAAEIRRCSGAQFWPAGAAALDEVLGIP